MSAFDRYPLPVGAGVVLGVLLGVGCGWLLQDFGNWGLLMAVLVALGVGLFTGLVAWNKWRLLCGWVVAMVPTAWAAHAEYAGLLSEGAQGANGHRIREPLKVAKGWKKYPKIKEGALKVPVKTNSGGLNRKNAQELANNLADVLQLSSARVEYPQDAKNSGVIWLVMSEEDKTR